MRRSSAVVKKSSQLKNGEEVSILIQMVKAQQLNNSHDVLRITELSNCIFDQWKTIREKYRKKAMRSATYDAAVYAEHEAQEELVVGLLFLLNDKFSEFALGCMK